MTNKPRPLCYLCKIKLVTLSRREHGKQRVRGYLCTKCFNYHTIQGELLIPLSDLTDFNSERTGKEIREDILSAYKRVELRQQQEETG